MAIQVHHCDDFDDVAFVVGLDEDRVSGLREELSAEASEPVRGT